MFYSNRMRMLLRSGDLAGSSCRRWIPWAPPAWVEAFAEAVGRVAAVRVSEQIEAHQIEQLRDLAAPCRLVLFRVG